MKKRSEEESDFNPVIIIVTITIIVVMIFISVIEYSDNTFRGKLICESHNAEVTDTNYFTFFGESTPGVECDGEVYFLDAYEVKNLCLTKNKWGQCIDSLLIAKSK